MFVQFKHVQPSLKGTALTEVQYCQSIPEQIPHNRQLINPYLAYQGQNSICSIILLTQYIKNTMLNPKLQYNYSNNNYIPELLMAGKLHVWCFSYVPQFEPLIWDVKVLQYAYITLHHMYITLHSCWNGVNILVNQKCDTSVMYGDW